MGLLKTLENWFGSAPPHEDVDPADIRQVGEVVREVRDSRVRIAFLESELVQKYGYTSESLAKRFKVYKGALKAQVVAS